MNATGHHPPFISSCDSCTPVALSEASTLTRYCLSSSGSSSTTLSIMHFLILSNASCWGSFQLKLSFPVSLLRGAAVLLNFSMNRRCKSQGMIVVPSLILVLAMPLLLQSFLGPFKFFCSPKLHCRIPLLASRICTSPV
jgi:hypothetical protein